MKVNVRGREKFHKYKKFLILLSRLYKVFPLSIRIKLFEFHRITKGTKGIILRYALLKSIAQECGDNVSIHPEVYLLRPEKITIGDNVSIHPMCYIDGTGGIEIGNDVAIAQGATILSTTHNYESREVPINNQGTSSKKTVISDNVWIGAKATILYGRRIGYGSIIGANSVVTVDIPENKICGGIPAKIIRER